MFKKIKKEVAEKPISKDDSDFEDDTEGEGESVDDEDSEPEFNPINFVDIINKILPDLPKVDPQTPEQRISKLNYSRYETERADSNLIRECLEKTVKAVKSNLTLLDILNIARVHPTYMEEKTFKKVTEKLKVPASKKTSSPSNNTQPDEDEAKPYDFFLKDQQSKSGEEKENAKQLYSNLTPEDKITYIYKALRSSEKKAHLTKSEQEILNNYEGKPTHPGTAFTVFLNEKNAEPNAENVAYSERIKLIGSEWKQMDKLEKERYERIYSAKKEEYDRKYEQYLSKLPKFRLEQESKKFAMKRRNSVRRPDDEEEVQNENTKPKKVRKRKSNTNAENPPVEEVKEEKGKKRKVLESVKSPAAVRQENGTAKPQRLPEPEKPPSSAKEYFKSIYKGDPKEAGRVFKRLSVDEKQKYLDELKIISDKYIANFEKFLKSLTKEEMTEYMRNSSHL